jgi:hypothetical protein
VFVCVQHHLGIQELAVYQSLLNLPSLVPAFPEILSRLLFLSKLIVTFTISALDGARCKCDGSLLWACYHSFSIKRVIQTHLCPNCLFIAHKEIGEAGCWWLKPVILIIQEAEMRRIEF